MQTSVNNESAGAKITKNRNREDIPNNGTNRFQIRDSQEHKNRPNSPILTELGLKNEVVELHHSRAEIHVFWIKISAK